MTTSSLGGKSLSMGNFLRMIRDPNLFFSVFNIQKLKERESYPNKEFMYRNRAKIV
jgi:hypothetical protein